MNDNSANPKRAARFTNNASALEIVGLTLDDREVIQEARRWTQGERGPVADSAETLASADLTRFVTEAIGLGARAIAATGQAQESQALSHLIKDVGDRATSASTSAADLTARATKEAADAIAKTAREAQKAVTEADRQQRKAFAETVAKANTDLLDNVARVFGGDHPELLSRLQPMLEKFGTDLDARVAKQTEDLLAKTARQFDPADPTSPMAKQATTLKQQYDELAKAVAANFDVMSEKLSTLETALMVEQAVGSLAKVTPIKGGTYEDSVNDLMSQIAAGLGDEYTATGNTAGHIARCKKGDGVLTLNGGSARVVLEMTDSPRTGWGDYLDIAERNRDAVASLGLVRAPEQNDGHIVRNLGPRRVVMAFDPITDSPDLLRTAVLLLRTSAVAAVSRTTGQEIDIATEKIEAAREQLDRIDGIKKTASSIGNGATKIERECDKVNATIRRTLTQALTALEGAPAEPGSTAGTVDGAA